jgi:hypothetical protein
VFHRPVHLSETPIGLAQGVVDNVGLRLQRESALEVLDGGRVVAGERVRFAEAEECRGALGIDRQGALVVTPGLLPAIQLDQGIAQPEENGKSVAAQLERGGKVVESVLEIALGEAHQA